MRLNGGTSSASPHQECAHPTARQSAGRVTNAEGIVKVMPEIARNTLFAPKSADGLTFAYNVAAASPARQARLFRHRRR